MTASKDDALTLEKLKIYDRLRSVEDYMSQGIITREHIQKTLENINTTMSSMNNQINGNESGIMIRLKELEAEKRQRKEIEQGFMKIAVGSITIAVGSAVLWIVKLIFNSAGKH